MKTISENTPLSDLYVVLSPLFFLMPVSVFNGIRKAGLCRVNFLAGGFSAPNCFFVEFYILLPDFTFFNDNMLHSDVRRDAADGFEKALSSSVRPDAKNKTEKN
jgi:hypothetical protein